MNSKGYCEVLNNLKRFSHLRIKNVPRSVEMVILFHFLDEEKDSEKLNDLYHKSSE